MDSQSFDPDRILEDLESAKTDEEVVSAIANRGEDEVSSVKDLAEWLDDCPEMHRKDAQQRLVELATNEGSEVEGHRRKIDFFATPASTLHCRLPSTTSNGDTNNGVPVPCNLVELTTRWLVHRETGHPLAPLVAAWQQRPVELKKRNERDDPILPGLILPPKAGPDRETPDLFVSSRPNSGWLPDLAPGDVAGDVLPEDCVPLVLWDLSVGTQRSRNKRGAPLPGRIFVDVVLDVRRRYWDASATRGVLLPPQPFSKFLRRFYLVGKNGQVSWDKRRLPAMLEAFEVLESEATRIAWVDPETGVGGNRRIVVPVDVPRRGRAKDWVRFQVWLPPGAKTGPLVDRPTLRQAGAHMAPAWRLHLSLAAYWHKPGERRRPLAQGSWAQRKTWDAYRVLMDSRLQAMAFPQDRGPLSKSGYRSRVNRAQQALAYLEKIGYVETKPEFRGRRIRPGPKWVGWS